MKIIWWKFSVLILSWVLLAIFLTLMNRTEREMTFDKWKALTVISVGYLILTTMIFKPLTHKTNEKKSDP